MEELIKSTESRAKELTQSFKQELSGFRTNRPNPQLLENIQVAYADQMLPIKHLGSISIQPPRELQIHVWDINAVAAVSKAIEGAKIGVTPSVQRNVVRVFLPPMSDERREELKRLVKALAEKFRIQLRALRDEANKKVENALRAKEISEDNKFKLRERIQKAIDMGNGEI